MALPLLTLIPAIASGFGTVASLVKKFFPNDADRAAVAQIQAEIKVIEDEISEKVREHEEVMANLDINKLQAQSDDKFVSRARPFAMWGVSVGSWVFFGLTPLKLLRAKPSLYRPNSISLLVKNSPSYLLA